ncbi:MAG TPA: hypothetical protein VMS76_01840 [Planctomycetota bacterium]|nr:hypothetical protein [Planctomycetota bacterium]
MRLLGAALALAAAGCQHDYRRESRLIAPPAPERAGEVLDRRREYFDREATRPKREWRELILPDGSKLAHGKRNEWYEDGSPAAEREFERGEPCGRWVTWYRSGVKRFEYVFDAARPTVMSWWHENGQLSSQGGALQAVRVGPWTSWYPSGAKESQGSYAGGKRDGEWSFWEEDGTLAARGTYRMGVKIGEWERADALQGSAR